MSTKIDFMNEQETDAGYSEGLKKPTPPTNNDPERQMINNKIVDKIWSVITQRKLYNTYTQDLLEKIQNRYNRYDC